MDGGWPDLQEMEGLKTFALQSRRLGFSGMSRHGHVFSDALPAMMPDDGRIVVLTSNVTFSASIALAAMLKRNGGAPAGQLHDWSNGCSGEDNCFLASEVYAGGGISLEPAVEVSVSFEDYIAGRDTLLETALSELDGGIRQ